MVTRTSGGRLSILKGSHRSPAQLLNKGAWRALRVDTDLEMRAQPSQCVSTELSGLVPRHERDVELPVLGETVGPHFGIAEVDGVVIAGDQIEDREMIFGSERHVLLLVGLW